jgi:hypothetical protein
MARKRTWLPFVGGALVAGVAIAVASCGGTQDQTTLALRTRPASTATHGWNEPYRHPIPAPDAGVDAGLACEDDSFQCWPLEIVHAKLLVRRTVLVRAPPAADAGASTASSVEGKDWEDEGDCECGKVCRHDDRVEIGPFVIDLCGPQLKTQEHEVFDLPVPPGNYRSIQFVVNTTSRPDSKLTEALREMKHEHASILVTGTWAGEPFEFKSPMRVAQRHEGLFSFGEGMQNVVTFVVDPATWFVGSQGEVLDPRDPSNRGDILANIRCSLRMFPGSDDPDDGSRAMREDEGGGYRHHPPECCRDDEHRDWDHCHKGCDLRQPVCGEAPPPDGGTNPPL